MKDFSLSNLLIPLGAAAALYFPLSGALVSPDPPSNMPPQILQVAQPSQSSSRSPNNPGVEHEEAARLLCDFLGARPPGTPQNGKPGQSQNDARSLKGDYCRIIDWLTKIKIDYKIEHLIATIPDPKDSRLDYLFDRNLGAIQRAIEADGFVLDLHSLPWEKSKSAPIAVQLGAQALPQIPPRHLREPGVVLYRKTNPRSLLLLYLIGETPTTGIHKPAFQNALGQIKQLSRWPRKLPAANGEKIRVMGPSFSGSASSLELALKDWLTTEFNDGSEWPVVKIISGSATAIDRSKFLKSYYRDPREGALSFNATTIEDTPALIQFILKYLDKDLKVFSGRNSNSPDIAILTEGNTRYGQVIREELRKRVKLRMEEERNKRQVNLDNLILSLTFPLHISQLRSEAAKSKASRPEATGALTGRDPNLPLPMGEGAEPKPRDVVPLFSPLETVSNEMVLSEILTAIHRERLRYIGLFTTDVQDRIFLAREIRRHCPNTVIFTFSSDLLYLHSEANMDFQGALVVTPYPLFALNQLWTTPHLGDQKLLQFATPTSQGCYNATLALLGREDIMLEYGLPFKKYGKDEKRQPALWIGIVGRNGIWPVKALKIDEKQDAPHVDSATSAAIEAKALKIDEKQDAKSAYTLPVPTPTPTSGSPMSERKVGLNGRYQSPMGISFLLIIGLFCLVPPAVMLSQLILFKLHRRSHETGEYKKKKKTSPLVRTARSVKARIFRIESRLEEGEGLRLLWWFKRSWLAQVFGDEEFYCYRFDRRIYLMACCISLLIISLFISGVAILPEWFNTDLPGWSEADKASLKTEWSGHRVIPHLARLILACTLGVILWLAVSIVMWLWQGMRRLRNWLWAFIWIISGALITGLVVGGLYRVFREMEFAEQVFFFLRTTEPASGVSLLAPIVLTGLAAFMSFFAAVRRLNLAERMPCLPADQQKADGVESFLRFEHDKTESFRGLKALEDRVKEMIVCHIFDIPGALVVAAAVLLAYYRLFYEPFVPSVDGRWFDMFFKVTFYLVPMLLVWAFLRFFWLWVGVRKLLRRLSWHPLFSHYAAAHSEDKRFESLPEINLMTRTPTYTALSLSVRQARRFLRSMKPAPERAETLPEIERLVEVAENGLSLALFFESKGRWQEALKNRRDSQAAVAELTRHITELLEDSWRASNGEKEDGWTAEGKFFLITHVTTFLQHVFAHLQNLVALVTAGLLLILLAANSYPFQPREPLLLFSWVTILTAVSVTVVIFVQMGRDKVLSLLAGTTPGHLNLTSDFVMRVLIHAVIPIVALLGVQFPEALRRIFSWLSVFEGKGG